MLNYVLIMLPLMVLLLLCMHRAYLSPKDISTDVYRLLAAVMAAILGNVLIATSPIAVICKAGYMIYFIGTDFVLFYLLIFSIDYCGFKSIRKYVRGIFLTLSIADSVSILLDPIFDHVFAMKIITLDSGESYQSLIPYWYHDIHLFISYIAIALIVTIYIVKLVNTSRIFWRKYIVIFAGILLTAVWETLYVFLEKALDTSMIGFAVCGIFIYYYSIERKPVALLDRMKNMILTSVSDAIVFFNKDGNCIYANDSAKVLFNVQGDDLSDIQRQAIELTSVTTEQLEKINSIRTRREFEREDGVHIYDIEYHKTFDGNGHRIGSFSKITDRTEEIRKQKEEQYLATHDLLTGIDNAESFYSKVRKRLDEDPDTEYVAVASDIKEFKLVNDRYGRAVGDRILVKIARTLEEAASEHTIYGRIGSDRFGALMRKEDYKEETILQGISEIPALSIDTQTQYPVIIHVGIYEITERDTAVSVMFDRCFMAISGIKNDATARIAYYDEKLREDLMWEQRMAGSLDNALLTGQIVPYLQAQVNRDGRVEGAEVLVRWIHPEFGFLPPGKFIGIFEKNGMISKIDKYMWESACRILNSWSFIGREDLYLSVNISPKDFYLMDVPTEIINLVNKYDIDPRRLRLEITESIVMDDAEEKIKTIEQLRANGFLVEMDDFGSGYSSLNMLKDMPIDVLKLDMVFLNASTENNRTRAIMKLIIDLAKALNIPVIAEGVETQEQVDFLSEMGCDYFQGYYFAKPVPLMDYESKTLKRARSDN
ncbi:MAG: EAL domain-containing protein [Clostridiales bacterium]|nr:EAL domain-containing protein [Clostridiales bacterium]